MSITSNTPETVTLVKEDTANKNTFRVTLNLDNPTITTTNNGTVQLTSDNYINNVTLTTNVVPASQTKTVTITENGTTAITPDNNIPYLDSVIVNTEVPQTITSDNKISKMQGKKTTDTNFYTLSLGSTRNLSSNTNITSYLEDGTIIYGFKNTSSSKITLTTDTSLILFMRTEGDLTIYNLDSNGGFYLPASQTVFANRRLVGSFNPQYLLFRTSNNQSLVSVDVSEVDRSITINTSDNFTRIFNQLLASDFTIPITP